MSFRLQIDFCKVSSIREIFNKCKPVRPKHSVCMENSSKYNNAESNKACIQAIQSNLNPHVNSLDVTGSLLYGQSANHIDFASDFASPHVNSLDVSGSIPYAQFANLINFIIIFTLSFTACSFFKLYTTVTIGSCDTRCNQQCPIWTICRSHRLRKSPCQFSQRNWRCPICKLCPTLRLRKSPYQFLE